MKNVIITLLLLSVFFVGCNRNKSTSVLDADPCDDSADIARLETEVKFLKEKNAELQARLNECMELVELAPKKEVKKTTKSSTPAKKPVAKATPKPAPKPAAKEEPVATTSTPRSAVNIKEGVATMANLAWLQYDNIQIVARAVFPDADEQVYFPQYIIDLDGAQPNTVLNNTKDGHNWQIQPTDGFQGDIGVTKQGVFYINREVIEKPLEVGKIVVSEHYIELLGDFNRWGARDPMIMSLQDGYYVLNANPN